MIADNFLSYSSAWLSDQLISFGDRMFRYFKTSLNYLFLEPQQDTV